MFCAVCSLEGGRVIIDYTNKWVTSELTEVTSGHLTLTKVLGKANTMGFVISAIVLSVYSWTSPFLFGWPMVVWFYWGEIEPFSAALAQDGLAECDQPGKNPLKYSTSARKWTRATARHIYSLTELPWLIYGWVKSNKSLSIRLLVICKSTWHNMTLGWP